MYGFFSNKEDSKEFKKQQESIKAQGGLSAIFDSLFGGSSKNSATSSDGTNKTRQQELDSVTYDEEDDDDEEEEIIG